MKNDLHIRTNFSASADPNLDFKKVLEMCERKKLDRISITDFDTCLFPVINILTDTSSVYSGKIISGMECDVCEKGITFELLAYNFDPIKTLVWSYQTYGSLKDRQTKIKNELVKIVNKNKLFIDTSKEFNAKTDFAHKYVFENMQNSKENQEFFAKNNISNLTDFYNASTKKRDFPLYLDMCKIWPNTKTVTDFIHSVGGFVVLAQPLKSNNRDNIDFLLKNAIENNIDGIEVYHPSHTKDDEKFLLNFAHKNKMIVTGGSNFNGKEPTNELGIKTDNEDEILKSINL